MVPLLVEFYTVLVSYAASLVYPSHANIITELSATQLNDHTNQTDRSISKLNTLSFETRARDHTPVKLIIRRIS